MQCSSLLGSQPKKRVKVTERDAVRAETLSQGIKRKLGAFECSVHICSMSEYPNASSAESNESTLQTRILPPKYLRLSSTAAHLVPVPGIGGFSSNIKLLHVKPYYKNHAYMYDVRIPRFSYNVHFNQPLIPEIPTPATLKRAAATAALYNDHTLGYQTLGQPAAGGLRYTGEELIQPKKAKYDQSGSGETEPKKVVLHPLDLDVSLGEDNLKDESDDEESAEEEDYFVQQKNPKEEKKRKLIELEDNPAAETPNLQKKRKQIENMWKNHHFAVLD